MYSIIFKGFLAMCLTSLVSYKLMTTDLDLSGIKDASIQAMTRSITDDLDRAMPMINAAGYKVFSIQAQLSIPPKVNAIFERERVVATSTQELILKSLDDNMIGKLVLTALMESFEINKTISLRNMSLKKINIGIGFPPSVIVDYR
jgi:hypothetical protein